MLNTISKNKITTGLSIVGGLGLTGAAVNYYLDNAIYYSIANSFVGLKIAQYTASVVIQPVTVIALSVIISINLLMWYRAYTNAKSVEKSLKDQLGVNIGRANSDASTQAEELTDVVESFKKRVPLEAKELGNTVYKNLFINLYFPLHLVLLCLNQ
jgi:hypothetical protein